MEKRESAGVGGDRRGRRWRRRRCTVEEATAGRWAVGSGKRYQRRKPCGCASSLPGGCAYLRLRHPGSRAGRRPRLRLDLGGAVDGEEGRRRRPLGMRRSTSAAPPPFQIGRSGTTTPPRPLLRVGRGRVRRRWWDGIASTTPGTGWKG